jgi:F0F1-type ATP synthase assembly protein I
LFSALGLAWELGYTIAVPLVVLALLGRLADKQFGTSPWLLLVGILLSIVASTMLVLRKTKAIMEAANSTSTTKDTAPKA